ncbi:MAG TPA: insulinase family protein, partial [Planctomycetaceae bacterium]|nr:insulinase family protein [Planctomycetaceae bacterium]
YAWHDPGVVRLMAEVNKGNAPELVLEGMLDVLEQIGEKGVTEEEVERARVQFLKQRELSAANTSAIAVELSEWQAQGDWRLYFLFRDRVEAVKPADVQRVAAKYFKRDNRTVGLYIPTEKAEKVEIPTTPNVLDLVKSYKGREEIALGEAFDVSPANIEKRTERTTLGQGVKAALLPKKTRGEVVQVRVTIRYGSPKSLGGLNTECEFLPELMTRGTKKLTRQELQDELDRRQARLSANGSAGIAIFSVQTKKANLIDVLDLLRQVLREPSLPANELDILKHRQLASLEESNTEPRSLASRSLARQLSPYSKDDVRYVATIPEEIEMVKGLARDGLEKLYSDYLGAQQIEVSVVGDFDVPATKQKLTAMLADWKAPQPYARIERSVPESWKPGVQTIETPEKANAVYYAGLALPIRDDDPDYPALVIGDFVLGAGALSSRLGDRIRQREGLSYGVASNFNADSLDERGTLSVFAICNPSNMKKVEVAVKEELDRLLKDGLGKEELERAITGYLQRQEVSRTDDSALAQTLNSTLFVGRTMDYYAKQEQQIRKLTPEQVQKAMKSRIPVDKLIVIEAGDFAALSAAGK